MDEMDTGLLQEKVKTSVCKWTFQEGISDRKVKGGKLTALRVFKKCVTYQTYLLGGPTKDSKGGGARAKNPWSYKTGRMAGLAP